ncbi:MAG: ComEC/Rec2-related protein [Parcubacteria group bacterium GW2011_GWA2_47_7]|nr:MAG: ComEC/Rec2-related protein [Parcubacteria group bacterium GW2011_GWA2_47_7]
MGLASVFELGNAYLLLVLIICFSLSFVAAIYQRSKYLYLVVLIIFAGFGMMRYSNWHDAPRDLLLEQQIGESVVIIGVINDEPDIRENSTRLLVSVRSLSTKDADVSVFGRMQISVTRYPAYEYGDLIRVKGKLIHPEKFVEDDGRVFDYPAYLAVEGVHYQIPFPAVELVGQNEGNAILATLFVVKHQFLDVLGSLFPEPENALLGGLLLGGKQSLGTEWQDIFRRAGIVHIVVLSGYNMTIVSEWLVAMFRFLGFYGSLSIGSVGIVLFALMTGAGATVLRAAIMAIIALLARATGRTYTMGRALLVAGVCMVLQNPSILAFDPSFQLSFLASIGLIFVSPVIEVHTILFKRFPVWREVFVSTLATQMMVLPLLLYQTGMFSLVSLPVNMLVLPLIPFTMLFGFIAGVVGIVFPVLGGLVALPAHALLSWILFTARASAQIPYAAVSLPISVLSVFILYVTFSIYLWRAHVSFRSAGRAGVLPLPPSSSTYDKK